MLNRYGEKAFAEALAIIFLSFFLSGVLAAQAQQAAAQDQAAAQQQTSAQQPMTQEQAAGLPAPAQTPAPAKDIFIKNATVMTATHGKIEHGSVLVHNGKIAAVGTNVAAPAGAEVIDATGKFVTPGLIDCHSHIAMDDDVNEATSPITPQVRMIDAFDSNDKAIYRILAGGVTTSHLLHGSANMIGGQSVVIKHKYGLPRAELLFPNAPADIKFASGENPKRVYGGKGQIPSTREGNFEVMRESFTQARDYMRKWDDYNAKVAKGDKTATPPDRDLKMDALANIMRGKFLVQLHIYRADEFLTEMQIANEFGYKIRAFHHALEAYKVADQIAKYGAAIATWPDWWGFKFEAYDATPWNAVISMRHGVRVALKSDSSDLARRLNQEAGKVMRYGGATEQEALQMITLNPAWILGIDDRVGSIDVGKDADLVIWNSYPLSSFALADQVFIDGEKFFDRSLPGYGLTHVQAPTAAEVQQ